MPVQVTYGDYVEFGGKLGERAFDASVAAAQAEVDFLVGRNEVVDDSAYRRAVFLAVDAYDGAACGGSVRIGSFSSSGAAEKRPEDAARDAALGVLSTTGMVYAGLA